MIRNIVFDMGGVLINFDPQLFMDRVGLTDPADRELIRREVYISLEWAMMDSGRLTDAEAAERMCKRLPERLHDKVRLLVTDWDRPIVEIEGMYDLIDELKSNGYRIYLLSNASVHQHDYWSRISCSKFFDGTFVSCDYKMVKPELRIYSTMCDTFGIEAGESVFIDDVPINAEGAERSGLSAIVFHRDIEELRCKLAGMGVNVKTV